jgi:hypothetical protein
MIRKPKKVKLPKTLVSYTVCNSKGEHCAVGYLLHKAGVSNDVLRNMTTKIPFIYNDEEYWSYKDLFRDIYDYILVNEIIHKNDTSETTMEKIGHLKNLLNDLGIKYYGEEDVKET